MRVRRKPMITMNLPPEGRWCPACGSKHISSVKNGFGRVRCNCSNCGLSFTANVGMSEDEYAEACDYPDGPITIEWRDCASPMDAVRRFAVLKEPSLSRYAGDSEVFAWICDYWDYVKWNEHGNELSYHELAFEGGFGDIIREIVYDPGNIIDYLGGWTTPDRLPDREKNLIAGVRKINRGFSS